MTTELESANKNTERKKKTQKKNQKSSVDLKGKKENTQKRHLSLAISCVSMFMFHVLYSWCLHYNLWLWHFAFWIGYIWHSIVFTHCILSLHLSSCLLCYFCACYVFVIL